MILFPVLTSEILKLKRSRVLAVTLLAPALVVLVCSLLMLGFGGRSPKPLPFGMFLGFAIPLWAFFMLPLSVTLLSLITTQVEHSAKAWNYVLALPVARWRIFTAKVTIVLGLAVVMSVLLLLMLPFAAPFRTLFGRTMEGQFEWAKTVLALTRILGAALLLIAIQLWTALRFRGVAIPLSVGIGGGFVATVVMIGSQMVSRTDNLFRFFPWLLPVESWLKDETLRQTIWFGLFGGIVGLVALVVQLSRREAV